MSRIPRELLRKRYNLAVLEELEAEISDDDMIFDGQLITVPLNMQKVVATNPHHEETPMQSLDKSKQEIAANGTKQKTGKAALSGAQSRKLRHKEEDSSMKSNVDDKLLPNHSLNETIPLQIFDGQMVAAPLNLQQVAATNPHNTEILMQGLDKGKQEIASISKRRKTGTAALSGAQRRKRRRLKEAGSNINSNVDNNIVPNHSLSETISMQPLTKPNQPISVPDEDQKFPIQENHGPSSYIKAVISEVDKILRKDMTPKFKIPCLKATTTHQGMESPIESSHETKTHKTCKAALSGAGLQRLELLKQKHPNLDGTEAKYVALHRPMSEIVSLTTTGLSQQVVASNNISNNNSLRVRIQNEILMTEHQMLLVHERLLQAIIDCNDGYDEGPKFTTFGHISGSILIACTDYYSRNWLMRIVPTLKPWPTAKLTVFHDKEFTKRLTVITKIPTNDVDNIQDALTLLAVQNKRLRPYIEDWEVLNVDTTNRNLMVVKFGIDEASLLAIKLNNYKLYLGFNIVCIKIDKDFVPGDTPIP